MDQFIPAAHTHLCAIYENYFKVIKELGEQLVLIGGWGATLASHSKSFPPKESVVDQVLQNVSDDLKEWSPQRCPELNLSTSPVINIRYVHCTYRAHMRPYCIKIRRFNCQAKQHWLRDFYAWYGDADSGRYADASSIERLIVEAAKARLRPSNIAPYSLPLPPITDSTEQRLSRLPFAQLDLKSNPIILDDLIFHGIPLDVQYANKVVRITQTQVVKFGMTLNVTEGKVMQLVAKLTSIPVPCVYENFSRKIADGPEVVYLVMEYIEGSPLSTSWPNLDIVVKDEIAMTLRAYLKELRLITRDQVMEDVPQRPSVPGQYRCICTADGGPLPGLSFHLGPSGPFSSVAAYHDWYTNNGDSDPGSTVYRKMFSDDYDICFAHGDLATRNIMVNDAGNIVAVLDWGWAGWYPEYVEFVHSVVDGKNPDWWKYMEKATGPFYTELGMYEYMKTWG